MIKITMSRSAKCPAKILFGAIAGFTVVELLIALLLVGLITSASLALYITQQKQLMVQSDISDIQGSLRAAAGEITTRLRMAGYKLPEGFPCITTRDTNPDTVEVITNSTTLSDIKIEHAMPQPSSELRCDGHDVSAVNVGDTLYIYDPFTSTGESFTVSQVQIASSNIQHNDWPLSKCYPQGSYIFKIVSYKYYIDNSNAAHPCLMYQVNGGAPVTYAENITNLNFQYILSSGQVVNTTTATYLIREAIITISGRTDNTDNEFFTTYRTRTLTTKIKIRNLGDN
jgi:type II secretory pathway pseudopilin PulG